jgi:hypothetical protein
MAPKPFLSNWVRKPSGSRGASSFSGTLHLGHGAPAAPRVQACSPSHGRSGWLSHTRPQSSHREQFIQRLIPSAPWAAVICGTCTHGVLDAMGVNRCSARASHQRTGFLRRHSFASFPRRIFPCGPIPLIAPFLEIGLGPVRQEDLPCAFEVGAGLVEGHRRAVLMFAGMRAGIEAARPFSGGGIVRVADALGDRARADVAPIDVPAFLRGIRRSAANELGHEPMIAPTGRGVMPLDIGPSLRGRTMARGARTCFAWCDRR